MLLVNKKQIFCAVRCVSLMKYLLFTYTELYQQRALESPGGGFSQVLLYQASFSNTEYWYVPLEMGNFMQTSHPVVLHLM